MKQARACPVCNGSGIFSYFKDRDPIEGSKMSPGYNCQICEGKGIINPIEATAWQAYKDTKLQLENEARYARKLEEDRNKERIASAKAKLTDEEYKALTGKDKE